MKLFFVVCAGLGLGCQPAPVPAPPAVLVAAPPVPVASAAVAPAAPAGERYVGAVGGSAVHAELQIAPTSVTGRWTYDKGGKEGLRLTSKSATPKSFEAEESTDDGRVTGLVSLSLEDGAWRGTWTKPGETDGPDVQLTRELRSRHGQTSVLARTVLMDFAGSAFGKHVIAGFLPRVDGAGTEALARTLGLPALLDEAEADLDSTTSLDFSVDFHDARFVTFQTTAETMGAYPDSHFSRRTFLWSTGKRVGVEALLPAKRAALVRVLDAKVKAVWKAAQKRSAGPDDECNLDGAEGFGSSPVGYVAASLGDLSLDAKGLRFAYDFGFPHVMAACEPAIELSLSWAEAKPYLDPQGPLAGLR